YQISFSFARTLWRKVLNNLNLDAVKVMDFYLKQINYGKDVDPIRICLDSDEFTIGRRGIVSLNKFYKVSRNHAVFSKRNGSWFVRDLGSLNKLYVNFKEVNEKGVKVEIGDIIGFGTPLCSEEGSFVCVFTVKSRIKQEICDPFSEHPNSSNQNRCPVITHPAEKLKTCDKKENCTPISIKTEPPSSDYDNYESKAVVTKENVKAEQNQFTSYETNNSTNVIRNKMDTSKEVHHSKLSSTNVTQSPADNFHCSDLVKNFIKTEQSTHSYELINSNKIPVSSALSVNVPHPGVATETLHNIKPISLSLNNSGKQKELASEEVSDVGKVNISYTKFLQNAYKLEKPNGFLNQNVQKSNTDLNSKVMISSGSNSELSVTNDASNNKNEGKSFTSYQIKECYVRLVKCDSKYFQWPNDAKTKRPSENTNLEYRQSTTEKNSGKFSASLPSREKSKESQKAFDTPEENAHKRKKRKVDALQLKICKNRILSSDSEASHEEREQKEWSEEDCFSDHIASKSCEKKKDEKRDKSKQKSVRYHSKYNKNSLVKPKVSAKRKKDSTAKESKKKIKVIESDSDSSVSNSHCVVLYPSSKVSKNERPVKNKRLSSSSIDEDSASFSESDQETGWKFSPLKESENKEFHESSAVGKVRKTFRRTLLTDPKPMEFRPRRLRGREEYFRERHLKPVVNENLYQVFRKDLKQDFKRKTLKENKNAPSPSKNISPMGYSESKNQTSTKQDIVKSLNETCGNECKHLSQKKSAPAVPKRPNNYGSRMGFLVDVEKKVENKMENKKIASNQKTSCENYKNKSSTSVNVINQNQIEKINTSACEKGDETKISEINLKKFQNNSCHVNQYHKPSSESAKINTLEKTKNRFDKPQEKKRNQCPASSTQSSNLPPENMSQRKNAPVESNSNLALPDKIFPETSAYNTNKKVAIISPVNYNTAELNSGCLSYLVKQTDTIHNQDSALEKSAKVFNASKSASDPNCIRENLPNKSDSTKDKSTKETCFDSEWRLHSRSLIENIVHWNPKWLEEQSKNKKPPPLVSKGGALLPLRYSSYNSYVKSLYPMLTLETWESLFREAKPLWLENETWHAFYYIIRSSTNKRGIMELHCESIVNENLSYHPTEGTVVLLNVKNAEQGINSYVFGYISCHKSENICDSEKLTEWIAIPEEWQKNAKLWTFSIYVKKSKKRFDINSVNLARGIMNIKNKIQLIEALLAFKKSPLQKDILSPSSEVFSFYEANTKISRALLIQTVSDEIRKENPRSKTILINAPPGTGKTGAILGLVEQLLIANVSKMKILLCAPNNMSVDEIGLRLIELNERYSWKNKSIKFVRFGPADQIHCKLQKYTLEKKVSKMFKEQNKKELLDRDRELDILERKINEVLFREQQINNKYRLRRINNDSLKDLMNQLNALKEKSPLEYIDPLSQATYESFILKESDIILSTLDYCMHPLLSKFFKSFTGEAQSCCIVDEATQSTEPEILQCLHPKVTRLVLIGDTNQLPPPVISAYAIKWGFKRSLMERLLTLFSKQYNCIPSLTMAEQYRMQTQICHFPSKHFYNEQLVTNCDIDNRYMYSHLKPFIVYNILLNEMSNPSVNPDDSEPLIIAYICSQLLQVAPNTSIGVIATSEYRAALYRVPLSHNDAFRDIEINVVEKYQGREKDIIVLACIHPFHPIDDKKFLSCEKRMNVAITRARQCLIVCGHISSLTEYPHWNSFIDDAQKRNAFTSVSSLQQIPIMFMKTVCKNA
ncbi:probable helicase MAGATAMA 3, partial [Nephila pilipes]